MYKRQAKNHALAEALSRAGKELTKAKSQLAQLAQPPLTLSLIHIFHEGGLAVLRGNLAPDGCVVKTAGVPPEIWKFRGPALVVDSQEQAIEVILNDTLKPGMALVIRYEGPKGGPGMQEMLYPTSFVKGRGIGKQVRCV